MLKGTNSPTIKIYTSVVAVCQEQLFLKMFKLDKEQWINSLAQGLAVPLL